MKYVLTLSVGPVQGFIAAARRSRDLWAGSWLLSELAKAVAKNLHDCGKDKVELIFPFVENNENLQPDSDFSVGNKIQAVITVDDVEQLKQIADNAKNAANERFLDIANKAKNKLGSDADLLRNDIWDIQVNDYVEVQYAWAQIMNNDYRSACETAAELLAARKATRDFEQQTGSNLPKSSLDGARETVLPEKQSKKLRNKLHLNQSEQLDCVGVVKRLCGKTEQFTPITRVAANDWIVKVAQDDKLKADFEKVKARYEKLVLEDLATPVLGNQGIYSQFPYDAQYLYSSRLNAAKLKADPDEQVWLNNLQDALKPIWKEYGEPCPYFAMLLADGDKMGELLDKAKTQENHQDITKALSAFAQAVPETMRDNKAQCIYSGGDDVLGLATLSDAVECAKVLQEKFSGSLKDIADELKAENPPTLSVGLAICHVNTPLGNIRALAKRAEKIAKGDKYPKEQQRNALGITLAVRSGATTDMRLRWDDTEAFNHFETWIKAYRNGTLSSRVAYDCRDIFMRTDFVPPKNQKDKEKFDTNLVEIRQAELKRMLKKARDANGKELCQDIQNSLLKCYEKLNDLNELATELITARWLAAKTQRDLGRDS